MRAKDKLDLLWTALLIVFLVVLTGRPEDNISVYSLFVAFAYGASLSLYISVVLRFCGSRWRHLLILAGFAFFVVFRLAYYIETIAPPFVVVFLAFLAFGFAVGFAPARLIESAKRKG